MVIVKEVKLYLIDGCLIERSGTDESMPAVDHKGNVSLSLLVRTRKRTKALEAELP